MLNLLVTVKKKKNVMKSGLRKIKFRAIADI